VSVSTQPGEIPNEVSPSYDLLQCEASKYFPSQALDQIERAYALAQQAHAGQYRKSGEPYLVHVIATAYYLARLRLDVTSVVAGLLHDTIEDTEVTYDELEAAFGHAVARIVDGVSKQQAENVRKMFLAMAEDPRVVIVKLADRLHNMRTLDFQPPEKQKRIALDTREIYAPLAGRLGIAQMKTPLEDLAFKYLEPEAYTWLTAQLAGERASSEARTLEMAASVQNELALHGIDADVTGRAKHLYSIYVKLMRPEINMNLDRIYDLFALRVILDTVSECYQAIGFVHARWMPVPGRFKDYIAVPKPNGYQSLHTTVYNDQSRPIEVQIRTHAMHEVAEFGVATHWYYKEQGKSASMPEPLADWIQALIAWQNEINPDAAEFVDTLKLDVFTGQVFIFTPRGDILDLPTGSTPVDYAYRIHTELGHRTIGAKVNGMMVPLDSALKTGDKVEILTTKQPHGPGRDWLSFVRTANARQKIRQWFKHQDRDENIARGRELLEAELKKLVQGGLNEISQDSLQEVADALALRAPDDVFAQLGYGAISPHQVVSKLGLLQPHEEEIPLEAPLPSVTSEVRVLGVGDLLTRLASCCLPAPGDNIVGYITRNRGVTVHRSDCPRIKAEKETERLVNVDWGPRDEQQLYSVPIVVEAWDRDGLLRDITIAVAEERVSMAAVDARAVAGGRAILTATLRIAGIDQLSRIFARVERVKGVLEVRRQGRIPKTSEQTA
jgi:GTP pyrophosphokinase